jgi:uncharacterized RDD family membrane protein YckC
MSRPLELVWAALFVLLAASTILAGSPPWTHTLSAMLAVTAVLAVVQVLRPSYHGVFWRRLNPNLPQCGRQQEPGVMRYAGFWPRFGAMLVDALVLSPFMCFRTGLVQSRSVALAIGSAGIRLCLLQHLFRRPLGMTVGKCVLKLKVVSLDGEPAGFRRAFYRHSVDLALSVIACALTLSALMSVAEHEFNVLAFAERIDLLSQRTGAASDVLNWIYLAWALSELAVLLMNEKRRALHDFIAGTVVVHR